MSHSVIRTPHAAATCLIACALVSHAASPAHRAVLSRPSRATQVTRTIALSLPYREFKTLALGVEHGVRVAVSQANASHVVPGVRFVVKTLDDTATARPAGSVDVRNARLFIADPTVIGEVGPLDVNAAAASVALYHANGMLQMSLASAQSIDPGNPTQLRPVSAPGTYFHTCASDVSQAQEAALYLKKAGLTNVFVVDNQSTYGIGLAWFFRMEARKIGLHLSGYAELDPKNTTTSAQSLSRLIAAMRPNAVYFGGEYGATGGAEALAAALKVAGLSKAVFIGGDRIDASDFFKRSATTGTISALTTVTGGDPRTNPAARAFLQAEGKMFPRIPEAAYDRCAYDAAQIIVRAFAVAVKSGTLNVSTPMNRTGRLLIAHDVMAATKGYRGATGSLSFAGNGDAASAIVSIYKATGTRAQARWTFLTVAPRSR